MNSSNAAEVNEGKSSRRPESPTAGSAVPTTSLGAMGDLPSVEDGDSEP
jgi:hypothetical protein